MAIKDFIYAASVLFFRLSHPLVTLKSGRKTLLYRCSANLHGGMVKIGRNCKITCCKFHFKGNNNQVLIGDKCKLNNVSFRFENTGNTIIVGDGTTMESGIKLSACEGKKIVIGKDCMLADNIELRTTDSHSIVDSNGRRINPGANVTIGNHVWIGTGCLLLKGSSVPCNSVIGAHSLVNKTFDRPNSVYAGQPARLVKKDIDWLRQRL